jgi:hypothetical protein
MKYISVPVSYAIYEVEDDVIQLLSSGVMTQPPHVVLEVMVLNGQAKRVVQIGSVMINPELVSDDEEEDEHEDGDEEGEVPWVE